MLLPFEVPNNCKRSAIGKTFLLFLLYQVFKNTYIWLSKSLFLIVRQELMHAPL